MLENLSFLHIGENLFIGDVYMAINAALLSTIAALTGSTIGATAPILSNYVLQRGTTQRELLNHQIAGREELYSSFISEAAKLHAHSLTHSLEELDPIVGLHALVSRIRLSSSSEVVAAADKLVREIVKNYGDKNVTLDDMRFAALAGQVDPLHEFSAACRMELRTIFRRGSVSL